MMYPYYISSLYSIQSLKKNLLNFAFYNSNKLSKDHQVLK